MFTGIVECMATVENVAQEGTNRIYTLQAPLDEPVQIDQSISHDGVCLTVTSLLPPTAGGDLRYTVTAVAETLEKSHLAEWKVGTVVNLERSMRAGARLDGHFVQGHVDSTGEVLSVETVDGSWNYHVGFPASFSHLLVDKGSVAINGVSLTVVKAGEEQFSVTIIPYTYEHTNFHVLKPGSRVNLEFDILGKYIDRIMAARS